MKILYNITYQVERSILEEWLEWMKEVYIARALKLNGFEAHKLMKIIQNDEQGPDIAFACQFTVKSKGHFLYFHDTLHKELSALSQTKFGEKSLSFATLMEIHDESI